MKSYEVHITGDKEINSELDKLNIKNIIVELQYPNGEPLRVEYMSSFIIRFESFTRCFEYVSALASKLKSNIIRVKIESPYYPEDIDISLYMESHFIPRDNKYAVSKNLKSGKLMGTDRTYNKSEYIDFMKKWEGEDIELCIYDSFIEEDDDWLSLYSNS